MLASFILSFSTEQRMAEKSFGSIVGLEKKLIITLLNTIFYKIFLNLDL